MSLDRSRKILIVDDSPEDREVIRIFLNDKDKDKNKYNYTYTYTFREAELGERGLAQLQLGSERPDCVLLDFKLPDMDGLEFLNEVFKGSHNSGLAVIMLTGNGDEETVMQAIRNGATDYLSKNSLNAENLHWAVNRAIERAELQQRLAEQHRQLEENERSLRLALTAEHQARQDAETSQQRLAFLSEASRLLGLSLEYNDVLSNLVHLIVPNFADGCLLITVGEGNRIEHFEVCHKDAAKESLLREMLTGTATPPEIILKVINSGKSYLLSQTLEQSFETPLRSKELSHFAGIEVTDSLIFTPLIIHGKAFGIIGAVSSLPGHYTEADNSLMEELAGRLAISLENATLYKQVQHTAQTQEELNQLKDLFIAIATHELRNPLTAAKGFIQLLKRNLDLQVQDLAVSHQAEPTILSKNLQYLDIVIYQLERMNGLIDQLIDSSRVHNKKLELHYVAGGNISEMVKRVTEQQGRIFPDRNINFQAGEKNLTADFDEARLEQVITNLITNAIKYSPEQSPVTVGIEKRSKQVVPEPSQKAEQGSNSEIVVWIRDEGYGIKPEDQARIFERFYRGGSGGVKGYQAEGLGLGLYISQEIVVRHGGIMWLESIPGKGSTFYFSIPIDRN